MRPAGRSSGSSGGTGADLVRSTIGSWIREHRELQNLTQERLCRLLSRRGVRVTASTLSRWERGERSPSADVLALLGIELGTSLATLEERLSVVLARPREELDVTGRDARDLVDEADRAARAGNYRRVLALLEAAEDALRLAETEPEPEFEAGLLLRAAVAHLNLWHLEFARDVLARFGALAGKVPALRLRGLVYRLYLETRAKDWAMVGLLEERILAELETQPERVQAEAWQVLGLARYRQDDHGRAAEHLARARRLWERLEVHLEQARILAFEGYSLAAQGEGARGLERVKRSLELAREHGFRDVEVLALHFLGRVSGLLGDTDSAVRYLVEAASRARALGLKEMEFQALFRAWELRRDEQLEAALRRLLRVVSPWMTESREFRRLVAETTEEDQ